MHNKRIHLMFCVRILLISRQVYLLFRGTCCVHLLVCLMLDRIRVNLLFNVILLHCRRVHLLFSLILLHYRRAHLLLSLILLYSRRVHLLV